MKTTQKLYESEFIMISPVLPSQDIDRDVDWYQKHVGFYPIYKNDLYAVLKRDQLRIHLQWYANTESDPLLGGSVIKIFVQELTPIFQELVDRQTVTRDQLQKDTKWNTHEFGFYDLNKNAIFFVEDKQ